MNDRVIEGQDNISEDLGFEPLEAANLKIKTNLILDLQKYIHKQEWTQQEAADFLNKTLPRISKKNEGRN